MHTQLWSALHPSLAPGQVPAQVKPQPSVEPQARGPEQSGVQQASLKQVSPTAQQAPLHTSESGTHSQVPVSFTHCSLSPAQVPSQKPPQPSGSPQAMALPQFGSQRHSAPLQALASAVQQVPAHSRLSHLQKPASQVETASQGPSHRPPHPSESPQAVALEQSGVQTSQASPLQSSSLAQQTPPHRSLLPPTVFSTHVQAKPSSQTSLSPGQVPAQRPPQPLETPQATPAQLGVHSTHAPSWQLSLSAQQALPHSSKEHKHSPAEQNSSSPGQGPSQAPPQPLSWPQTASPGQVGVQGTQVTPSQISPPGQQTPLHSTVRQSH